MPHGGHAPGICIYVSTISTFSMPHEEGPTSLENDLQDWKIEEIDDGKRYSSKERIIYQNIWNFNETL
jgi:hypothetical protein